MTLFLRINVAVVGAFLLALSADAGTPPQHYITGSWVNVRKHDAPDAPVIDHVSVNTPVRRTGSASSHGFCEVEYGPRERGYVACKFLGDTPLRLIDVDQPELNGKPNPNYSPPRAFWIQPSVGRLITAAGHFDSIMSKPGVSAAEINSSQQPQKLTTTRRFLIPELEAMKARLATGVIATAFDIQDRWSVGPPKTPKWKDIKAAQANKSSKFPDNDVRDLFQSWGSRDTPMALIQELELPATRASWFTSQKQVLPPYVSTETASFLLEVPYQARVEGGPTWVPGGRYNDMGYVFGAWDVGVVRTNLVAPVNKHTVFRDGTVRSEPSIVPGGRFPEPDADGSECSVGFSWGDGDAAIQRAVTGSSKGAGNRLFYYYSVDNVPKHKARVTRSRAAFVVQGFVRAETFRFDLDGDDTDDILVWEGFGTSEQSIHDPGHPQAHYRMVFFNIAGEWHLYLVDEYVYGCGC